MLTMLSTLALVRLDASRYTVTNGSSANLAVAGFVVGALHNELLPSRYGS
jgi:hypothetical protein